MRFTDIVFLTHKKHSGWGQIGFGWEGQTREYLPSRWLQTPEGIRQL